MDAERQRVSIACALTSKRSSGSTNKLLSWRDERQCLVSVAAAIVRGACASGVTREHVRWRSASSNANSDDRHAAFVGGASARPVERMLERAQVGTDFSKQHDKVDGWIQETASTTSAQQWRCDAMSSVCAVCFVLEPVAGTVAVGCIIIIIIIITRVSVRVELVCQTGDKVL